MYLFAPPEYTSEFTRFLNEKRAELPRPNLMEKPKKTMTVEELKEEHKRRLEETIKQKAYVYE